VLVAKLRWQSRQMSSPFGVISHPLCLLCLEQDDQGHDDGSS
jgi:hypothetical protein